MKIETKEDWNMVLEGCGCCPMPLCPVPGSEWQSVTSFAKAYGFVDGGRIYHRKNYPFNPTGSTSNDDVYAIWNGFGWGVFPDVATGAEYENERFEYTGDAFYAEFYEPYIEQQVYGRSNCFSESELYQYECGGTQVKTWTQWGGFTNEEGPSDYNVAVTYTGVTTYTECSGEETEAHAAWVAVWVDQETWQAAHDLWVTEHAAWQAASDAYEAALAAYLASPEYLAWEEEWNEWNDGGQIGDEPVQPPPPEEFTDPEPVEPDAEPEATWPPCTWRRTLHEELFSYEYDGGFGLVPGTPEVPNPEIVDSGPDYGINPDGAGLDPDYEGLVTYAEVLAAAQAGLVDVDYDGCAVTDPLLVVRKAEMISTDPLAEDYIEISLIQPRFKWVIPQDWTNGGGTIPFPGSQFKVTWDILEEPDGWDDPDPTVFRSFHLQDQTWVWTGPGDPEVEDSWKSGWYIIPPPTVPGTRRVVNIRFECYDSAKFGNRPQVTGEAVELPDP